MDLVRVPATELGHIAEALNQDLEGRGRIRRKGWGKSRLHEKPGQEGKPKKPHPILSRGARPNAFSPLDYPGRPAMCVIPEDEGVCPMSLQVVELIELD